MTSQPDSGRTGEEPEEELLSAPQGRGQTPPGVAKAAKRYFALCRARGTRPTMTGLALALGYSDRQELFAAAAPRDDRLAAALRRAKTMVEMHYETQLCERAAAGAVFALKNSGWRDDADPADADAAPARLPDVTIRLVGPENTARAAE